MNFAKKQLEKYGWKEGEGLGKHKKGIAKAIKPKLKFDTGGLGHDLFSDIHNTWWQRLYDEAAKKLDQADSTQQEKSEEIVESKTKKKKSKKRKETEYKGFVKTSQLEHSVETKILEEDELNEPEAKKEKIAIVELTDEELFKACGGRTAHKGARHGLKMNAKLARLEQQESSFGVYSCEEESKEYKKKKSHKKKKR